MSVIKEMTLQELKVLEAAKIALEAAMYKKKFDKNIFEAVAKNELEKLRKQY